MNPMLTSDAIAYRLEQQQDRGPTHTDQEVGMAIRLARKRSGMRQDELSGLINRSVNALSKIESGQINITMSILARVAVALDKHPASFLWSVSGFEKGEQ